MNENMGEQVNKGKEETPSSTHSKETLQALADLGYPKDSRNQLTPEEVSKILEKQISYKKEISLPKTGEDHDARELERLQEAWQKAFDEMLDNAPKNEYGDVLENTNRTREEAEKYLKDNKNTLSAESIIFISTSIMVKKKKEEIASNESQDREVSPKRSWINAHADGTPQEQEFNFLEKQWSEAFDAMSDSASPERFDELYKLTNNQGDSQALERYLKQNDQKLTTDEKKFIRASISLKNFRAEHGI